MKKYFPFITSGIIILLGIKAYTEGRTTFAAIALVFGMSSLIFKLYLSNRNRKE